MKCAEKCWNVLGNLLNFAENLLEIREWNKEYAAGKKSYSKKINQFSDMSFDQFSEKILMKNFEKNNASLEPDTEEDLPYPSPGEFECPYEYKPSENTPAANT
mgnify:CR=1 FL=1